MYGEASVGVVVPAYNEAGFVGETIETVPGFVDRIYPVDDASTDGTREEIERAADRVNARANADGDVDRVRPLNHEVNRGVGAAIKTGYARALEDGVDVVAVMAGDGQMDPDTLPRIVGPVADGTVAFAKGNRLHREGDRAAMSRWRLFGNGVLTMLTRIATGYWDMTDPQNGYTAISREALEVMPFERLYDRYGFLNDLLAMLNGYEFRIADVPHRAVYGRERSDIRYATFVPVLSWILLNRFLWRITTRYLVRGFNPLVLAYPLGFGAVIVGATAGVYSMAGPIQRPILAGVASLTLLLVGAILVIMGMWFDMVDNGDLVVSPPRTDPTPTMGARTFQSEPAESPPTAVSDGGHAETPPIDGESPRGDRGLDPGGVPE